MPTKTFPSKAALEWLETLQLSVADTLELAQHQEDLQRFSKRCDELNAAIAELSQTDEDVLLLMQTPGIAQFSRISANVVNTCHHRVIERVSSLRIPVPIPLESRNKFKFCIRMEQKFNVRHFLFDRAFLLQQKEEPAQPFRYQSLQHVA